jgi:hypothetical protein
MRALSTQDPHATREDIHAILGDVDERVALEILALQPTVAQIEEAAVWARGEGDTLAREGRPLEMTVAAIVDLLVADEQEPEPGVKLPG